MLRILVTALLLASCGTEAPPRTHKPGPPGGDDDQATLPTTVPACAGPTAGTPIPIPKAIDTRVVAVRLAYSGTAAAIAWSELAEGGVGHVQLQRLAADGTLDGEIVPVGDVDVATEFLSLTASGTGWLVCYGGSAQVLCAKVAPAAATATAAFSVAGDTFALVTGIDGPFIAYATETAVMGQALDDDGAAKGEAVTIAESSNAVAGMGVDDKGFTVALQTGANAELYRIDNDLTVDNMVLGIDNVQVGAVGGHDPSAIMDANFSGIHLHLAHGSLVNDPVDVASGAGQSYGPVAAFAADEGTFAVAWSDESGTIKYRATNTAGNGQGTVQAPLNTNWDECPVALTGVGDGFLLAGATSASDLSAINNSLALVHLACP